MTSPAAPRRCTQECEQHHGQGRLLIIYGAGPEESEKPARAVQAQCGQHGVTPTLEAIDATAQIALRRYHGLFLSLPTAVGADVPAALQPSAELVCRYRAQRTEGLGRILDGSLEWHDHDVGVVHLAGRRAILHHPALAAARARADVLHYLDSEPVDAFQIYTQGPTALQLPPLMGADEDAQRVQPGTGPAEILEAWHRIQTWGATRVYHVPRLRLRIDECRTKYENPDDYPVVHRPLQGYDKNQLDIILDGPHDVTFNDHEAKKRYKENGAGVVRKVVKELRQVVPELDRPGGTARGSQKELRSLYQDLRIVEQYIFTVAGAVGVLTGDGPAS